MLSCRQFLDELCDYLDGTAGPRRSAETAGHLEACPKCRILCETTRQTVRIYRRTWSVCSVPADVEARLMSALEVCIRAGRRPPQ